MAPRRRPTQASASPAAGPSLLSLPDELLVACLEHLSLEDLLWNVVLVSRRFRNLCQGPQLLSSLDIVISGNSATVVQRARSLLAFFTAHARHMRDLWLDVQLPQGAPEQQRCEVAALVTGCLTACGAAGGALQTLGISAATPLGSTAWLQSLTSLQHLQELGSSERCLQLEAGLGRLTALRKASLIGRTIEMGAASLPPSLEFLYLEDHEGESMPAAVGQLSRLTELRLNLCDYSGASLEQVAALPLQCLQLDRAPLPPCLAALTGLTLLSIAGTNEDDEAVLDRALPSLTNLRHLLLDGHGTPTFLPGSLTALTSLERLFLRAWSNGEPARFELPGGPWLLTLRWLGLPFIDLLPAVGALTGAGRLEYLCCLEFPQRGRSSADAEDWDALWGFLAAHPPLRCFAINASSGQPSVALLDALLDLKCERPGLQLRRMPRGDENYSFWYDILDCDDIPEGAGTVPPCCLP